MEEARFTKRFEGEARIGKVLKNIASITLKPEDFSSPIALQMAISRIYESMIKMMESGGPKPRYVAEVRIVDDMGNTSVLAVDLGEEIPPFSKEKIKARVTVELYEED
ncbi:MAG: hypothetical protein F7C81_03595 [Desulfurococcales archaeon]|nr:hypothetical protein [Desulfurococcales archaeon]MEB3779479.1 hypothetical protein [Desulfurococcales archaeon]